MIRPARWALLAAGMMAAGISGCAEDFDWYRSNPDAQPAPAIQPVRTGMLVTTQWLADNLGDPDLVIIHVGKDRRTDGSWGDLYGHVMFTDPILEENVAKDAP